MRLGKVHQRLGGGLVEQRINENHETLGNYHKDIDHIAVRSNVDTGIPTLVRKPIHLIGEGHDQFVVATIGGDANPWRVNSDTLEIAFAFPVGDGLIIGGLFRLEEVDIMIHDGIAEDAAGKGTGI